MVTYHHCLGFMENSEPVCVSESGSVRLSVAVCNTLVRFKCFVLFLQTFTFKKMENMSDLRHSQNLFLACLFEC